MIRAGGRWIKEEDGVWALDWLVCIRRVPAGESFTISRNSEGVIMASDIKASGNVKKRNYYYTE